MTFTTSGHKSLEQQLNDVMEQPFDMEAQAEILAEIRASVEQYEKRYGMSSDRIHEAIDSGKLVEDFDVCHWIFQYELLQDVEAS
jgi:phage baseplate assembly protein W